MQKLVAGPDVPDGHRDTTTWNYQFELVVAALLVLGGIPSIDFGEPDIVIPVGDHHIGVAAKRISSRKQVAKRFGEAIDQAKASGHPSLLVLSLDWPERQTDNARLQQQVDALFTERMPALSEATQYGILGAWFLSLSWDWNDERPRSLTGVTICQHGHVFAGDFVREIQGLIEKFGHNVKQQIIRSVKQLDSEASHLMSEEQIALARDP